jgi:acyl-CoA synthetase (AMP-forming)/AMP-acid ligase II
MIYTSPTPEIEIPDVTLHDLVLEHAAERGDRPALIDAVSGHTITYGELDLATRRLAAGLQALGFEPGQVAGIFAPNIPEYPVAYFGVARAGGTSTTVNGLYTERELAEQLRNSGARFLFTIGPMLDRALPAAAAAGVEAVFTLDGAASGDAVPHQQILGNADDLVSPRLDPATALVALPYSSGTTGFAKGVMLSHRNMVANVLQMSVHVPTGEDAVIAGVLPFFHIYGQTAVMNVGLLSGGVIITLARFDLEQFLRMVEHHRVTRAFVVPPIIVALAKHPLVEGFDSSSLEMVNSGAAPLDAALEHLFEHRIGVRIQQGYGLTEASPVTHCTPLYEPHLPGSIGKLLPNTEARIVDVDSGADVEPGVPGEILIRGPQVMCGYLGNAEATAGTLDADGWLHTGDIGVYDRAGGWRVVDRLKELIKFKGYQVPPAMLEAVLHTHPAVADACVVPVADEEAGEIPKAFVVASSAVSEDELMAFVAAQVAPHERVRSVEFIDEIPKSPAGKLLRRVLVERERAASATSSAP